MGPRAPPYNLSCWEKSQGRTDLTPGSCFPVGIWSFYTSLPAIQISPFLTPVRKAATPLGRGCPTEGPPGSPVRDGVAEPSQEGRRKPRAPGPTPQALHPVCATEVLGIFPLGLFSLLPLPSHGQGLAQLETGFPGCTLAFVRQQA